MSQSHCFLESVDFEYLLSSPEAILWQCGKKKIASKLPLQLCLVHYYILIIIESEQIYPQLSSCTYSAVYWRTEITGFDVLVHYK